VLFCSWKLQVFLNLSGARNWRESIDLFNPIFILFFDNLSTSSTLSTRRPCQAAVSSRRHRCDGCPNIESRTFERTLLPLGKQKAWILKSEASCFIVSVPRRRARSDDSNVRGKGRGRRCCWKDFDRVSWRTSSAFIDSRSDGIRRGR
jgi:hypothetical protein